MVELFAATSVQDSNSIRLCSL